MVHRKANKAELRQQPAAQQALDQERRNLEAKDVWDFKNPVSWPEIAAKAREEEKHIYVGNLLELATHKHAELDDGDPTRGASFTAGTASATSSMTTLCLATLRLPRRQ